MAVEPGAEWRKMVRTPSTLDSQSKPQRLWAGLGTLVRAWMAVLPASVSLSVAAAAGDPTPAQAEFFEKRIRPVLAETCYRCHSAESEALKGGLKVDSREALLKGGENGPAIVPGDPEHSRLVEAVRWGNPDLQMPPRKRLAPAQVADLEAWVRDGAPWPKAVAEASGGKGSPAREPSERARRHWAFRLLAAVKPPASAGKGGTIDAFLNAKLAGAGLEPAPRADARALVRRLSYDLTGLPPEPEWVEAFEADPSDEAWARLVDRLLASPHYGEKWGRHWLDLVRFAETNSYETDEPKPHAWRYRDYVIRAFNEDKPFDRFVVEQLAGDEIPDGGAEGVVATGYYRLGIWDSNPADEELARYDQLDDLVATTGQVFLGLTIDCARCHDHKIDPVTQRDYYSLLAFFRNIAPFKNGGPGDEVELPGLPGAKALAVTEPRVRPGETFILIRGNPGSRGERVEPGTPAVLGPAVPGIEPPAHGRSSGRRLALARWLVSGENPLTARVFVNRVWQHHFGRGLVRTPSDFGFQGDAPTHPELLDWLAKDFMDGGWRVKRLHRQILLSEAYRAGTRVPAAVRERDPSNDLFSRFEPRRLTAEEIRDSVLWVSGAGHGQMTGPGVYVKLSKAVLASQSVPGKGWGDSPASEQARRSVYIHVKRSLLVPELLGFDLAETDRSTPVRFVTTQPTQALGTMNGAFFNQHAALLGRRVRRECGDSVEACVRWVLHRVTGRPPAAVEVARGVALVEGLERGEGLGREAALDAFCLVALNLNEFVYLD